MTKDSSEISALDSDLGDVKHTHTMFKNNTCVKWIMMKTYF